jgi:hypothetical protein
VQGNILFSDGTIAANIQMFVEVPDVNYQIRARADEQGHYRVDDLPLGNVYLYPYNTSALYPVRSDMFFSKNPDSVQITRQRPSVTKNLIVPAKAGIIEGTVVSYSGIPISGAHVVLCHSEEVWRSAEIHSDDNGHFRYIVPTGEAISVYTRSGDNRPSQQADIVLSPGETRNMKFQTAASFENADHFEGEACKPFRPNG